MMLPMPYFRMPYYRRYRPYYGNSAQTKIPTESENTQLNISKKDEPKQYEKKCTEKREYLSDNSQVFNIMGITLHFDDILIICLLFFLYSEGVKDEMLFIALILLLLS